MIVHQQVKIKHKAITYAKNGLVHKRVGSAKYEFILYGRIEDTGELVKQCRWWYVSSSDSVADLVSKHAGLVGRSQRWRVVRTADDFVEEQG